MLADQLDYIVGVNPHRDSHAFAVVRVVSGAIVFEATVAAGSEGSVRPPALSRLVDDHRRGSLEKPGASGVFALTGVRGGGQP